MEPTPPPLQAEEQPATQTQDSAAQAPTPKRREPEAEPVVLIPDEITLSVMIQQLLKSPLNIIHSINRNAKIPWLLVSLLCLAGFALFGFILGIFSAGDQLWAAPVKITGGILFSALICLPSFYIFGNLAGMETKMRTVIGILLSMLIVTSLLLLGFVPVLWLFSTASTSIVFFGFLALATWLICLTQGMRLLGKSSKHLGGKRTMPLFIWAMIFTLVTLQMPTTLRPIIGETDDTFINTQEKKFFLVHWVECLSDEPSDSSTISDQLGETVESDGDEKTRNQSSSTNALEKTKTTSPKTK